MAEKKVYTAKKKEVNENTFTKEQIVRSKKYSRYVDFLEGNLIDGELYTHSQIEKYLKGQV